jgi:glycosyltransferase 2 family protein
VPRALDSPLTPLDDLDQAPKLPWRGRALSLAPRLAASVLIAFGFFWVLRWGGLPMFPPWSAFGLLSWWALPSYVVLYAFITFLRTYRWLYLLRPIQPDLSTRRVLGIGLVGFAAIMFAPMRMGEVVRPWLISQDRQVSLVQGVSTVVAERIVDGLTLTVLLMVSLTLTTPLSPLPERVGKLPLPVAAVPAAASGALLLFSAAFVAMALFYFWRDAARRAVHAVVGVFSLRLARWLTTQVERLADGLRFLPSGRHGGAFLRDTLVYWALSALSTTLLLRGCGAPAGLLEGCVTMGIMGIGTLIPGGPGFFGTYQLAAYCALAMFFPESLILSAGALFTFVSYMVHIIVTALSAPLGAWLMASGRSRLAAAPNAAARPTSP